MAPAPVTDDYYLVLEVVQTATSEQISRSYKRLALKVHPDRNTEINATEAFQLLARAYETLKDESKRRAYDLNYPSIKRSRSSTQEPRPSPASTSNPGALSEAAQIALLKKSKQERGERWWAKKKVFDSSIFELQREVRRLEQEIKNLDSIVAAEIAEEAQKNSWAAWLLSPIYKKAEDSEEEKARKDRGKQERRIEKDWKERLLGLKKTSLSKEESLLKKAKEELDAGNAIDDGKIQTIQNRIWARESRERQERERVERERKEKIWKERQEKLQKQAREAAEALRKQQAEERAAEQKRQEEERRKWEEYFNEMVRHQSSARVSTRGCIHDGWWPKVLGRKACPRCSEVWTYLLECPGCKMKACPKCQAAVRPRRTRFTNQRPAPMPRSFSPDYFD